MMRLTMPQTRMISTTPATARKAATPSRGCMRKSRNSMVSVPGNPISQAIPAVTSRLTISQ